MRKLHQAVYVGLGSLLSMISLAAVAVITKTPFVFPSLGPTAYLLYFAPRAVASSPRASILGHGIGLLCGYLAFTVASLIDQPPSIETAVDLSHIISAGLSLGLTCFFLVLFRIDHPPAGATTLIVALGLITHPWQLLVMEIAIIVLLLQAIAINRLFGYPVPPWQGFSAQD